MRTSLKLGAARQLAFDFKPFDPTRQGLMGAALGATAGGLGGAALGGIFARKGNRLRNAVRGGLVGAGLGGAALGLTGALEAHGSREHLANWFAANAADSETSRSGVATLFDAALKLDPANKELRSAKPGFFTLNPHATVADKFDGARHSAYRKVIQDFRIPVTSKGLGEGSLRLSEPEVQEQMARSLAEAYGSKF